MQRFWEFILGLDRGFLSREGEFHLSFNPSWPWQDYLGVGLWNFALAMAAFTLVVSVYRREGRSQPVRVALGVMRGLLLAFLILLLNRPVLTLTQTRTEPSVVAVMIDDSISMRVRDSGTGQDPQTRLAAAVGLLNAQDQAFVRDLRKTHTVRLYSFDADRDTLHTAGGPASPSEPTAPSAAAADPALADALARLQPTGQNTQVAKSIRQVLDDLQGQRLAGVVVFTDGRDTPAQPLSGTLALLKDFGVKVFPVPVGSDQAPRNIELQTVTAQDAAFKGDIINVRAQVRATGMPPGQTVTVQLKDRKTGAVVTGPDRKPSEQVVAIAGDQPVEVELQLKADTPGTADLVVEAVKQAGELDDQDNTRQIQVAVLDAQINVLYVDGYPRWEYRYLKNELIRDPSINVSCLLTSADPTFRQEGDSPKGEFPGPIARFPETIEELLSYDVVIFGDVDPRQFSDAQLQLVHEFVSARGGGFGMVSGPRFSPQLYRGTPIEAVLPVNIARVQAEETAGSITVGFRPVLTRDGLASSIFRFVPERGENEKYLRDVIPPIFWYCRNVTTKAGVGEVYAEHPTETGSDGRRCPILVFGRFGAGRTMFSAIDDSWRWRLYTGESVFNTYWVQQLRQLARGKKLGQRRVTIAANRPVHELGEQVRLTVRVLDPQLVPQLPDQIRVDVYETVEGPGSGAQGSGASPSTVPTTGREPGGSVGGQPGAPVGALLRQEALTRQEGAPDSFTGSFTADRPGKFVVRLPAVAGGIDPIDLPIEVSVPRLELSEPQVDRTALARLASETLGQVVPYDQAASALPRLLPSAARVIPIDTSEPLWDAPLAMLLFVLLITVEWVMRKVYGML